MKKILIEILIPKFTFQINSSEDQNLDCNHSAMLREPMHDGACDAPDTPMVIDQDVSMKNIKDQKQSTSHMPEDTPDDHAEYHGGYFMYDFNAESTLEPSNVWIAVPTPNPPPLKRKLTPKPPSCPPPEHLLRSQSAEPGSSFKKQRETPGAGSKWA